MTRLTNRICSNRLIKSWRLNVPSSTWRIECGVNVRIAFVNATFLYKGRFHRFQCVDRDLSSFLRDPTMPIDVAGQLSLSWREESTSNEKSRVCVINRDDEEISRIFSSLPSSSPFFHLDFFSRLSIRRITRLNERIKTFKRVEE